ncbi:MAG: 16S rRNA (cytidine(1402)-2'-O)-methyltransferase [Gammaproteobacteria bacterium]|nr:16S rRNA (cytidine(1402)-2'-O)-methyltransferase [Gammaproteobacteria bacterium]MBT8134020.1 16S rRNA (cytidine(1402)-2'-O)-methyltransferase [Gammaproteobacteria bacterium]NNJ50813.1 16S rRNA (cytidine(1402)-2'-O)-methyltransferase [Gammaproteobacteria bacterium]
MSVESPADKQNNREPDVTPGSLYLVATPIGNLADITQRAVEVLGTVDMIAAEDTRHSQRLLSHLGIRSKLLAYHEHNEDRMTPRLLDDLLAGSSIALISDAGTPLISDPGYRLVSQAHDRGVTVVPVPGVCAAIAALSAAGLATDSFTFEGFPPAKQGARLHYLERLATQQRTMIFYVSCHRIIETLKDMLAVFGGTRRLAFARELTKTFETIKRAELSELIEWVENDENQRKGEIVLIVEGKVDDAKDAGQVDHYLTVLLSELPVKQAVKLVVKMTGENKNDIYKRALELKGA